jgi:hypothetical protein
MQYRQHGQQIDHSVQLLPTLAAQPPLLEVTAKGSITTNANMPSQMNGRLTKSLAISVKSPFWSNQA